MVSANMMRTSLLRNRFINVGIIIAGALVIAACSGDSQDYEPSPAEYAPERPYAGMSLFAEAFPTITFVHISRLDGDGPAARAGVRPTDLVLQFDGRQVHTTEEMMAIVEAHGIGDVIDVKVERPARGSGARWEPEELTLQLTLAEEPDTGDSVRLPYTGLRWDDQKRLGLALAEISHSLGERYGLTSPEGVLVLDWPRRDTFPVPAHRAPIPPGHVITSIMGKRVNTLNDVQAVINGTPDDVPIEIVVRHEDAEDSVTLPPLGPDVPGANQAPAEARIRLLAAMERGDLHREYPDLGSWYYADDPRPGVGGGRIGEVVSLSDTELTIRLFSTDQDWSVAITPDVEFALSTGTISDLRPGEYVMIVVNQNSETLGVRSLAVPPPR